MLENTVMLFLEAVELFKGTVLLEEMGHCDFTDMPYFLSMTSCVMSLDHDRL